MPRISLSNIIMSRASATNKSSVNCNSLLVRWMWDCGSGIVADGSQSCVAVSVVVIGALVFNVRFWSWRSNHNSICIGLLVRAADTAAILKKSMTSVVTVRTAAQSAYNTWHPDAIRRTVDFPLNGAPCERSPKSAFWICSLQMLDVLYNFNNRCVLISYQTTLDNTRYVTRTNSRDPLAVDSSQYGSAGGESPIIRQSEKDPKSSAEKTAGC